MQEPEKEHLSSFLLKCQDTTKAQGQLRLQNNTTQCIFSHMFLN